MGGAGKFIAFMLIVVNLLTYSAYKLNNMMYRNDKELYEEAISSASQIAALDLIETDIDINDLYDGNASVGLSGDIKFNAIDIFKNTLYNNIEMKIGNRVGAGSMNVPLVGIVAHDYVVGENESGLTYPPLTYSYYNSQTVVPVEIRSKLWEFNLGNETVKIDGTIMDIDSTGKYVSYTDETTGVTTQYNLSSLLSTSGYNTIWDLRDYVVMSKINLLLDMSTDRASSKISQELGQGLEFDLATSNYSSDKKVYNSNSSVINGPGIFAVVDLYKGSGSKLYRYDRIASFGGSELSEKH